MSNDSLTPEQACAEAIRLAGGPRAVARHFQISPQAVSKWNVVPETRCLPLARLIGYRVPLYAMRPDVYGVDARELRAALAAILETLS
jgi:DNA-binding transcriptional regulator YdaS (Cro superfamily)